MAWLVAATMLPFVLYAGYRELQERDAAQADAIAASERAALAAGHALDLQLERAHAALALVEPMVADLAGDPAALEAMLRRAYPAMAGFASTLTAFSAEGRAIARGHAAAGPAGVVSIADRPHFRALRDLRVPMLSEPIEARPTGERAVALLRPLMDRNGELRAVLTATMSLEHVERVLGAHAPSAGTQLWVATTRGNTVARWPAGAPEAAVDARALAPFRVAGDGQRFRGRVTTPDGVERVGASVPVSAAPWQVFVGVPVAEALAAVNASRRGHLAVAGAMLLASLLGVWYFGRRLTRPVLQLREAVKDFAQHGAVTRVAPDAGSEIGALAEEIHRMSEHLAEAQSRLTDLLELSSDWYFETDAAMRFTLVSGALGNAPAEDVLGLLGRTAPECGIVATDPAAHERALQARAPYRNAEFTVRGRDGAPDRTVIASAQPRFAADGTFLGYRGACRDVSESRRLQDSVRSARERLRLIVDTVPALISYIDAGERYVFCNRQYAAIFGSTPAQLVGRPVGEVIGDTPYGAIRAQLLRALAGERVSLEVRYGVDGAEPRDYLLQILPDADAGGAVRGAVGMMIDVSEQRAGARALAASERRFRELIELSSDWYWEQDADYRFTYQSGSGRGGRSDFTALIGRRRWDLPAQNMAEADWAAHRARLERREPFHDLELLRLDPDGRPMWAAVSGRPIHDARGRFAGYCGVGRDITARKLAEIALQAERDRLARVIGTMGEGLVILDVAGCFTHVNEAALRILRTGRERMLGRHFADASWMPLRARSTESAGALSELFYRLGAGTPVIGPRDHVLADADGTEVHLSMTGARLQADDGGFAGVVVTFDDISERKAQEREIVALNEDLDRRVQARTAELRLAYRDMESFSYNVSHDLRAPLRAISGFTAMVVEDHGDALPRDARRLLDRVARNAERMEQLIEALLAFGKLSRQPLALRRVSVRDIVDDVVEELRPALGRPGLELRIGPLPDAWADPVLLRQVFANLVSNALKYSAKAERPRIEIGAARDAQGTVYTVRDNGAGFDMAYAGRLFGMFQRLHAPAEFEGSGVGLAMVRRIVERHGGEIWAESSPGAGATFSFRLDGRRPSAEPAERPRARVALREVGKAAG